MANSVQLTNYTDFDRILLGKNFIITVLGAALAFTLSYLQIFIPIPVLPYNLSLAIAVMIFVSVYTSNIASVGIVVLIGSLGYYAQDGSAPDFFNGLLIINLVLMVTLGYLSDRLQLVMNWTKFYLWFAALFSIISIGIGFLWYPYSDRFWELSPEIAIGRGGDIGTGLDLPVLDIIVLAGLLLLIIIIGFILRGEILLGASATGKYKVSGLIFVLLGLASTVVPLYLFGIEVSKSELKMVADYNYPIEVIPQLFTHAEKYSVFGEPVSIFFIMAATTTFTCIGLALYSIGQYNGNLEGTKGGANISLLAAPLAILAYFAYAHYYVQSYLAPLGFYIPVELLSVFAGLIWMVYLFNQWAARILLFIFKLF